ncbi:MAG: coiled-coil domain-containing protein [Planctomycetota bacterium]|jgi:hypothetical protein
MRNRRGSPGLAALVVSAALGAVALLPRAALSMSEEEAQAVRDRAGEEVKKAYDALHRHDSATAVESLRSAMALLQSLGAEEIQKIRVMAEAGGGVARPESDPALAQLAFILEASVAPMAAEAAAESPGFLLPDYQRKLAETEEMRKLKEEAQKLREAQQEIAAAMREMAEENAAENADEPGGQEQAAGQEQAGQPQGGQQEAGGDEAAGEQAAGQEEGGRQEAGGEEAGAQQGGPQQAAADALAGRQDEVPGDAAAMARRLSDLTGDEAGESSIAEDFTAAANARSAAGQARRGDLEAAADSAELAGAKLDQALEGLKGMTREEVDRLVDRAMSNLERVLREQREIREKTEAIAERSRDGGKPDAATLRDVKGLAPKQDELRRLMEATELDIAALRKWGESEAKHETQQSILAASGIARRSRVPQRMANAVVAYSEAQFRSAARAQRRAEKGVGEILKEVQDAYRSMASDPLSELKAAKIEAGQVAGDLAEIMGEGDAREGGDAGDERAGGQEQGQEQGLEQGQERGQEQGQANGQEAGRESAQEAGREDGEACGEQAGRREGGEEAGDERAASRETGRGRARPTASERREMGVDAARQIGRLVRRVKNRDFDVPAAELGRLERVARERASDFGKLAEARSEEVREVLRAARRVRDRLEKEYRAAIDAKTLFEAQREECPPRYRGLVNKYFEGLSEASQ